MWMTRNPIGGIWLTKSPKGIAGAPFRPIRSARVAEPVGDHAGEPQDHADENHEMGGVLTGREPRADRGERVLGQVEDKAEQDRRGPDLRQAGDGAGGARLGHGGPPAVLYR